MRAIDMKLQNGKEFMMSQSGEGRWPRVHWTDTPIIMNDGPQRVEDGIFLWERWRREKGGGSGAPLPPPFYLLHLPRCHTPQRAEAGIFLWELSIDWK